ncbi:MAG: hypothetical protein JWO96_422 [Candidatus Saccharibacteria bacterium]|nr:hypothetical protein [Candidatus Saccharibacteria bacterium]
MSTPISPELLSEEQQLHASYNGWSADFEARPDNGLVAIEYDTDLYPEQSILVARSDAEHIYPWLPDNVFHAALQYKVGKSLGKLSSSRLINQVDGQLTAQRFVNQFRNQETSAIDPTPLIQSLREAQLEGQNTAVLSPHFKLSELAYLKGLRFVAKRDRPNIDKSGAILNKAISRVAYASGGKGKPKPVKKHFTPMGRGYWSAPKTESSLFWGVPERPSRRVNASMLGALIKQDMKDGGMEVDIAPTGSEIKPQREGKKITHYEIPFIDIAAAGLMTRFDNILTNSLVRNPDSGEYTLYIGQLKSVSELKKTMSDEEIVRSVFEDMRVAVEGMVQKPVKYKGIGSIATLVAAQAA